MTHRERLLAPFRGEVPDRPAWLADLSYWHEASQSVGTLAARYEGRDGYRALHSDLGVCYYYDYSSRLFDSDFDGAALDTRETAGERVRMWHSPAGRVSERWQYLPQSQCWAHRGYAVTTREDLEVLLDLCGRLRFTPCPGVFSGIDEWIGDDGVPLAPAPRSPVPALLADWCGVENTVFLLSDFPDLAAEVLAAIDRANDAAFDILAASPCELIHFCDNLDSSASTPFFEQWMKGYYEKRLEQLHGAGKHAVVHLDGRVRGLLPRLAACGFDGVESITPSPVGDVAIEELRSTAGRATTILWGGIPGAMFCPPWTAEDVRSHALRLLRALGRDGRLIVGSADQIPPDGAIERCRLIADTIEKWAG